MNISITLTGGTHPTQIIRGKGLAGRKLGCRNYTSYSALTFLQPPPEACCTHLDWRREFLLCYIGGVKAGTNVIGEKKTMKSLFYVKAQKGQWTLNFRLSTP